MHPECPLKRNNSALDDGQQQQGQRERHRNPYRHVNEQAGLPNSLDDQDQRHDDMGDDEDGEVRRSIVGAVVMKLFAAVGTTVGDLQIGGEQRSQPAGRTTTRGTSS